MFDAIAAKIKAQAEYVCWRDSKVKHGGDRGANQHGKRTGKISTPKSCLPAADPGELTAHRWRKILSQGRR